MRSPIAPSPGRIKRKRSSPERASEGERARGRAELSRATHRCGSMIQRRRSALQLSKWMDADPSFVTRQTLPLPSLQAFSKCFLLVSLNKTQAVAEMSDRGRVDLCWLTNKKYNMHCILCQLMSNHTNVSKNVQNM